MLLVLMDFTNILAYSPPNTGLALKPILFPVVVSYLCVCVCVCVCVYVCARACVCVYMHNSSYHFTTCDCEYKSYGFISLLVMIIYWLL